MARRARAHSPQAARRERAFQDQEQGTIGTGKKWNKRSRLRLMMASRQLEEETMKKTLLISALAYAASTIAQTAMAAEFYVVRDAATKKCTVVDTKPTTSTVTI